MKWTTAEHGSDWPLALVPILERMGVEEIELRSFCRPRSFLGKEVSSQAQELARVARTAYKARGYGFWDEMLNILPTAERSTRLAVLARAAEHNVADIASSQHSLSAFADQLRTKQHQGLPPRQVVSLVSRVIAADCVQHVPMLDLGTKDLTTAVDVIATLGLEGVLVASGSSFHFVGRDLMSEDSLIDLLAQTQLLSPLIDFRWAAHAIRDRSCTLRVSTDTERHATPWQVVAASSS